MRRTLAFLLIATLLGGCAHDAPRPTPMQATAAAAPARATSSPAPNDLLSATVWAQTAAEHDAVTEELFAVARRQLLHALADPHWDALPRGERSGDYAKLTPAVIVDVDETMLDNTPYQVQLIRQNRELDEVSWAAWCHAARARPIPGALEYARFAAAHGVTVFYISNRSADLDAATLENLRRDGFPVANPGVFMGLGTYVAGCEQSGSDKSCRRQRVGERYRVLQMAGDQLGDFVNDYGATPQARRAALTPYRDWLGTRWFMLPNPMYGGWESVLFHGDWTLPKGERRRLELDALDQGGTAPGS